MSKSSLYIHVGPPKTATSFLQDVVLGQVQSVDCLSKPVVEIKGKALRFADLFDFSPAVWRDVEENPFAETSHACERDVIVSDEGVFGNLASPTPWIPGSVQGRGLLTEPRLHTHNRPDPYFVSSHIRELRRAAPNWGYDQVGFLLTTRRQDTELSSYYAQFSNRVKGAGQQNFEEWVRYILKDVVGHNKGGGKKLDYFIWWREVSRVIGEENTLFIPFELLKKDQSEFLRRWLSFIGAEKTDSIADSFSGTDDERVDVKSISRSEWIVRNPIRRGPNLRPTRVFRALGLPTTLPLRWPDFGRDEKIQLTEELSREILGVYEEGNRLLDEQNPHLGLDAYEYY